MDLEFFRSSLADIVSHSLVAPDRVLRCVIIANRLAGGFTIRRRWKEHAAVLQRYRKEIAGNPLRPLAGACELMLTGDKGSGRKITEDLIAQTAADPSSFCLIITAGGDGTSLEVLSAMYDAPAHVRTNMGILRLPMGTGNDGADSRTLSGALDLLAGQAQPDQLAGQDQWPGQARPARIFFAPALCLKTSPSGPAYGKGPFLAFNILSMGLDAFVTGMTNKMKGKLPGDTYKLWVDIASLFYDRLYRVDYLDVRALDEHGREVCSLHEKLLLVAMGASGYRTYGAGNLILPDDRNVCAIKEMSILGKLALKKLVALGRHDGQDGVFLFSGHRLEITCRQPILAQMDGETILLQPEDFPAVIELTSPVIPLLKPAGPVQ